MSNFLRQPEFLLNFDRLSYFLGLLTGAILIWLLGKLRPLFSRFLAAARNQQQTSRQGRRLGEEIRLANDTLRLSQGWHLAAPLFSLNEILIPPCVLAPPVPPMAYEPPPSEDVTDWAVPYMPDWSELASFYGAPSLSLVEALQGGANLAVTGQPGSGKTVALAHLAIQIIHRDNRASGLADFVPLLLHIADFSLFSQNPETEKSFGDPFSALLHAVSSLVSPRTRKRLPGFLQSILKQGRALLILDGLDELSPRLMAEATRFLAGLFKKYPDLRVVVAASPNNLGELLSLGFQTLPLAGWNQEQRTIFIRRWSDLWNRYVSGPGRTETLAADPLLLTGWLANNSANLTPLELTLKVWAAFAGDSLGPGPLATIEAYLRRMTARQSDKNRLALEQLASQMVLGMQPVTDIVNAQRWLGGTDLISRESESKLQQASATTNDPASRRAPVRARGALPDLVESGLIIPRASECIVLVHPVITGYLVSRALSSTSITSQLSGQPEWTGKSSALQYLSILDSGASWIDEAIDEDEDDPLSSNLFAMSRWLRGAPEGLPWLPKAMRRIADHLQQESQPFGMRGRTLSALVLSGNASVLVLLRQMLKSPSTLQRQLAALGCGFLRDVKSVGEISGLVGDPSTGVSRAAILALVAIGDKSGLETVAYTLLHSDESLRRSAAEALTNNPEEGFPTLEDGSALEDPAVRRAVVFGLGRLGKSPVKQPWATDILEKMRTEDSQWVVQDAATQMLQDIKSANPRLPRPLPPLTHTAWLIAFAGERGMGVAPGKPAYEMLYRALAEGNEDQRIAALYYLSQRADEGAALPLYHTYFSTGGETRELAYQALWNLAASGVSLPSATQYGLR